AGVSDTMSPTSSLSALRLIPAYTPAPRKPRGGATLLVTSHPGGRRNGGRADIADFRLTEERGGRAARSEQRRRLGKTIHQVEVLHGRSAGPLDQVVDAANREHPTAHDPGRDVAEVRVGRVLGAGQVIDDPHER